MSDISDNIIYPSFFKINYEDKKNTFYLESLTLSDLKLWKKSLLIDPSNNITIQHREFSKLIMNLKNTNKNINRLNDDNILFYYFLIF